MSVCVLQVPIRVLQPLINDWLTRHRLSHKKEDGAGADSRYVAGDNKNGGAFEVLASHSGVSARYLRRIMNDNVEGRSGSVDYVSFDLADAIVCGTVGPMAWHEEPLNEFYGPFPVMPVELFNGYELPEGFTYDDMTHWQKTAYRKGLRDKALRMSA